MDPASRNLMLGFIAATMLLSILSGVAVGSLLPEEFPFKQNGSATLFALAAINAVVFGLSSLVGITLLALYACFLPPPKQPPGNGISNGIKRANHRP